MPANTLLPIELDPKALAHLDFAQFCDKLIEKLSEIKAQRFAWYDAKREQQSKWVNGSRRALAILGSVAILLTAMGTTLRIVDVPAKIDVWTLVIALVLYAVMGAVSFLRRQQAPQPRIFVT